MNDLNFFVSFIDKDKAIRRKKYIIALCIFILIGIIGSIYYFADREERTIKSNIAELKEYVNSAEVNTQLIEIRAKHSELSILNNYFYAIKAILLDFNRSNIITNDLITLINSTLPEDIVLNTINYTESTISFSGTALSRVEIAEFYYNLNQIEVFDTVDLGVITAFESIEGDDTTDDDEITQEDEIILDENIIEGFNFTMQCHLKGGGIK